MFSKILINFLYPFSHIGKRTIEILQFSGFTILLALESFYYFKNVISKRKEILKQMHIAGVRTLTVLSIVALFTGMIVALQSGVELMRFQQQQFVGNLVIAMMTREMGPFTTAIILIASVGSAMAAEIGTMKVSEEIDALEMMSISPVKFLVMPRVFSLMLVMPIATIYTNVLGTLGGGIVSNFQLDVSFNTYYIHVIDSLHFKATFVGLLKSFVFGIMVSSVCCAYGLKATTGAMGVGKATRASVVTSFLMVLIFGYIITSIFYGKAS